MTPTGKTGKGARLLLAAALGCAALVLPADATAIGKRLPEIKGTTLSGRPLALPRDLKGEAGLLLIGFTRDSQYPIEAWERALKAAGPPLANVSVYVLPMIGNGIASLVGPMIDGGMRRGTPKAAQDHVMSVYMPLDPIKQGLGVTDQKACIVVVDSQGAIAGQWFGEPDAAKIRDLGARWQALSP
jgi:hypothetical protein